MAERNTDDKGLTVVEMAERLEEFVRQEAADGTSLHEFETCTLGMVLAMGFRAVEMLIEYQGDGDLGETVETHDGRVLSRSEEPARRPTQAADGLRRAHV